MAEAHKRRLSTATTVTGWGLSVAWLNAADPDVIAPAAQVFGIGVGALAAAGLRRAGFAVELPGVAATATGVGLIFMLQRQADFLIDWQTYALALADQRSVCAPLAPTISATRREQAVRGLHGDRS